MMRRPLPCLLLSLVLAGGCRHPSPDVLFHTLRPIALGDPKPAPAGKPLALEIMPVQLPELLQRSQLVILEGPGSHRLSATHHWGNTLEKDMQRVLVENLSALLRSDFVVPYPLGDQVKATHRVTLDIQQCEGAPGSTLQFRATWMVSQPGDGRVVLLHRFNLQEPVSGGIEDLVSAHDRALDSLSREIAKVLQELDGEAK